MTVIYFTENNKRCYVVSFQKIAFVRVQNFRDISNDENNINWVKPLEIYLGNICSCLIF